MFVVVEHEISNAEAFWNAAEDSMSKIPQGVKLHHALPSKAGNKAVCLWEAESENQVRTFVERSVGRFSRNVYFAVDAEAARGLPAMTAV